MCNFLEKPISLLQEIESPDPQIPISGVGEGVSRREIDRKPTAYLFIRKSRKIVNQKHYQIPGGPVEISFTIEDLKDAGNLTLTLNS